LNLIKKIVESNWKTIISTLALASNLDFKKMQESIDLASGRQSKVLFEEIKSPQPDTLFEIKYKAISSRSAPDTTEKCVKLNGRQTVAELLKHKHLGEVKSFFLNQVPSRDFRPYDLITVTKHEASH
jgi:hypothetical protein